MDQHKCRYVTATCYDSDEALHRKYSQTHEIMGKFLTYNQNHGLGDKQHLEPTKIHSLIPEETGEQARNRESSSSEWEGLSPATPSEDACPTTSYISAFTNGLGGTNLHTSANSNISFHASISAKNLPTYRPIRRRAPYNKIVFNFPHIGGLSTDLNRQVRANQELLVAFFKSCKPLLASNSNPVRRERLRNPPEFDVEDRWDDLSSNGNQNEAEDARATGQVIISLFDGEPYSLWNIRDLARHSGFKVVTSWRFPWEAYTGYRHARTIGEIVRKTDGAKVEVRSSVGHKKRGTWTGEEREARGFVFEMVDEDHRWVGLSSKDKPKDLEQKMKGPRKKRRRSVSSGESDE